MEAATQIPWYYLAGADQYEHSLRAATKGFRAGKGFYRHLYRAFKMGGALNPDLNDVNPLTITFFDGIGPGWEW